MTENPPRFTFLRKLAAFDYFLLLLVLGCLTFGICCIYSATLNSNAEFRTYYEKQAVWGGIGLFACLVLSFIDYKYLLKLWWLIGAMGIALLIAVLIVGKEANNARSWIPLGSFNLQPVELGKLSFIVVLAWFLGSRDKKQKGFVSFMICCGIMLLYMALILKQPDLGSAMVFPCIAYSMMFVAGIALRWLVLGGFVGMTGAVYAYLFKLDTYQKNRILSFLNPESDPRGSGYHLLQSKEAIGAGGMWGKGFLQGDQNVLGYLPRNVSFSDFVFAIAGEEFGFVGVVVLIAAFTLILLIGLNIARQSRDMEGCLIGTGICALFFAHIFENIGMTIGVTPITGIPLPFISYGGTFLLASFIAIGLLQSVQIHRRSY